MKDVQSKISMRERGQSIFKIVGAIFHSKICYLSLTNEMQFFCKTQYTLFEDHFS